MPKIAIKRKLSLCFLTILLSYCSSVFAVIPSGFESYSVRPDIFHLTPIQHEELGESWQKLREGHLEAVAQLLEVYNHDEEIYFLARDSEMLYDFAKLAAQNEPKLLARLHLLNVSRANMRHDLVKKYLEQEGISEDVLKNGRKIIFVDTGFKGTIPSVIAEYFPTELHCKIKTHLMASANPDHPSTRVFFTPLNPATPRLSYSSLHGTIIGYEHLPRYTDRSNQYTWENEHVIPIAPLNSAQDGSVNREKAIKYQQDLKAFFEHNQELLNKRRMQWRELINSSREQQVELIKTLLALSPEKEGAQPLFEAMARDLINLQNTNLKSDIPAITPEDLGLKKINEANVYNPISGKLKLMTQYPQWKKILEDPITGIGQLVAKNEWGLLGSIFDVVEDYEITITLGNALASKPLSPPAQALVKSIIGNGENIKGSWLLHQLVFQHGSKEYWESLREVFHYALDVKNEQIHVRLAGLITNSTAIDSIPEIIIKLVNLSSDNSSWVLISNIKNVHVYSPNMNEILIELYKKLSKSYDIQMEGMLKELVPAKLYRNELRQFINFVIKNGSTQHILALASNIFSMPESHLDEELLITMWETASKKSVHMTLNKSLLPFYHPHGAKMKKAMRRYIELASIEDLTFFYSYLIGLEQYKGEEFVVYKKAVREAKTIRNLEIRKKVVDQIFGQTSTEPQKKKINLKFLAKGDVVETEKGLKLTVIDYVDQGKRGKVYKTSDSNGQFFALKVAIDDSIETATSFQKEVSKAQKYAQHGFNHAEVLEANNQYVVKKWIEGERLDHWLKKWKELGMPKEDPALSKLITLIKNSSSMGVYVGDLNAKNLILSSNLEDWVIVDSGHIQDGLSTEEALQQYQLKIPIKWRKHSCQELATAIEKILFEIEFAKP